ncbi:MAG: MAE_28990/MAE_18760 family HEPN-like nuclease [Thermoflexibacteraceae bacterium]
MNKAPRTTELLYELVEAEYTWRITELSNYRNAVLEEKNPKVKTAMLRGGVALLYAHWEGFIKGGADLYYEFVTYQDCKLIELNNAFVSIALKGKINDLQTSKRLTANQDIVKLLIDKQHEKAFLPKESPIRTSNLTYDIFQDICTLLGLDIQLFENKVKSIDDDFDRNIEKTINEDLVNRRNTIAHGKYLMVNEEEYKRLYTIFVNKFLLTFKDLVIDAAQRKLYLRNPLNYPPIV